MYIINIVIEGPHNKEDQVTTLWEGNCPEEGGKVINTCTSLLRTLSSGVKVSGVQEGNGHVIEVSGNVISILLFEEKLVPVKIPPR